MHVQPKNYVTAGTPLQEASNAIIMLHGRGSTAEDIISLAKHLQLENTAIFAPQATNYSWYPNSFMAPVASNQPELDAALIQIEQTVTDITKQGMSTSHLYFLGFSQGACLALEYLARNAKQYGAAVVFTGGLIGQELMMSNYRGDFDKTPILMTTGDPDLHVPLKRVEESVRILENMHADVTLKIYKGRPHTIQMEEINLAKALILNIETVN